MWDLNKLRQVVRDHTRPFEKNTVEAYFRHLISLSNTEQFALKQSYLEAFWLEYPLQNNDLFQALNAPPDVLFEALRAMLDYPTGGPYAEQNKNLWKKLITKAQEEKADPIHSGFLYLLLLKNGNENTKKRADFLLTQFLAAEAQAKQKFSLEKNIFPEENEPLPQQEKNNQNNTEKESPFLVNKLMPVSSEREKTLIKKAFIIEVADYLNIKVHPATMELLQKIVSDPFTTRKKFFEKISAILDQEKVIKIQSLYNVLINMLWKMKHLEEKRKKEKFNKVQNILTSYCLAIVGYEYIKEQRFHPLLDLLWIMLKNDQLKNETQWESNFATVKLATFETQVDAFAYAMYAEHFITACSLEEPLIRLNDDRMKLINENKILIFKLFNSFYIYANKVLENTAIEIEEVLQKDPQKNPILQMLSQCDNPMDETQKEKWDPFIIKLCNAVLKQLPYKDNSLKEPYLALFHPSNIINFKNIVNEAKILAKTYNNVDVYMRVIEKFYNDCYKLNQQAYERSVNTISLVGLYNEFTQHKKWVDMEKRTNLKNLFFKKLINEHCLGIELLDKADRETIAKRFKEKFENQDLPQSDSRFEQHEARARLVNQFATYLVIVQNRGVKQLLAPSLKSQLAGGSSNNNNNDKVSVVTINFEKCGS